MGTKVNCDCSHECLQIFTPLMPWPLSCNLVVACPMLNSIPSLTPVTCFGHQHAACEHMQPEAPSGFHGGLACLSLCGDHDEAKPGPAIALRGGSETDGAQPGHPSWDQHTAAKPTFQLLPSRGRRRPSLLMCVATL